MKSRVAFLIAGTAILLPTFALSAQPAPPATNQASTQSQTASGSENSAATTTATSQKCSASSKAAEAKPEHDPSALPGKDTGWVPPKRKAKDTASGCDTQPH